MSISISIAIAVITTIGGASFSVPSSLWPVSVRTRRAVFSSCNARVAHSLVASIPASRVTSAP